MAGHERAHRHDERGAPVAQKQRGSTRRPSVTAATDNPGKGEAPRTEEPGAAYGTALAAKQNTSTSSSSPNRDRHGTA